MSVWKRLAESYDIIKELPEANDLSNPKGYLLGDGLCTNKATMDISIDLEGNIIDVELVPKNDQMTIIPCTTKSIQRTVGDDPHPLFDKLQYIASDWSYILEFNDKELEKCNKKYDVYNKLLGKWADFTKYDAIKAIYNFISKTSLIKGILHRVPLDALIKNSNKDEEESQNEDGGEIVQEVEPDNLFDMVNEEKLEQNIEASKCNTSTKNIEVDLMKARKSFKSLKDLFVRFKIVDINYDRISNVWLDNDIFNEWSENYKAICGNNDATTVLSYISGENEDSNNFFPKKIRNQGDGARLMSANDETVVTFGDRFKPKEADQAAPIGNKSMQNALYALSWLINKQAFSSDGFVILTWSNNEKQKMQEPNIYDTRNSFLLGNMLQVERTDFAVDSNKTITALMEYGKQGKTLEKLTQEHKVYVLILDGESKGRIAVQYYNEFESQKYYQTLEQWFKSCQWMYYEWREFVDKNGKIKKVKDSPVIKTPLFDNIFDVAYKDCSKGGGQSAQKFRKMFYKEILQCVLNGKISKMLAKKAFHIVCNRNSFDGEKTKYFTDYNKWLDAIATTCAMFNSYKAEEKLGEKHMKLDLQETDRSYCFGRLLAILEKIEKVYVKERATNAERLFNHYSLKPMSTFFTLRNKSQVYLIKMKADKAGLAVYFERQINEILELMEDGGYDDRPLDEKFLLGYYAQNFAKNNDDNFNLEIDDKELTEE